MMSQATPTARIDAALARIETAVTSSRQARVAANDRHDRLKAEVAAAIASLDSVLAQGRDG